MRNEATTTGGFNIEKALDDNWAGELKHAERDVKQLEAKLDAARERVYRLRAIGQAAGLTKPEPSPADAVAEEPTP